ncbi:hypothetical protein FHR92_002976 [Fontibacillus solani]|uniref:Uncharacterized protein n=1 Tax=Fontibacillus solani TaxID=1572857 RepID=A0A7W3SV23_9BACL|nr:hypothetical protein [Fontibacillus solani]MBA9086498.1 hypothetical protein [Fontibacillus solani]
MKPKTLHDWGDSQSLYEFLQVGDTVGEDVADFFLNQVPPAFLSSNVIQLGECADYRHDRPVFATVKRENSQWKYAGLCYIGGEDPA